MSLETITKIEKRHYTGKVYNLEVEPNDSVEDDQYYVNANNGLVVHNCHPRDNIALSWLAKELDLGYDLFAAISHSREQQTRNMALFIADICRQEGKPCVINGRAYKPAVPYTVGSPSVLLGGYLKEMGIDVSYADSETGDIPEGEQDCVCVMAHDPQTTYDHTGKKYEQKLYFNLRAGCTVIDPWRCFEDKRYKVIYYGLS